MRTQKTKVTLLSFTANPLETIYAEWVQSRTNDPIPMPKDTAAAISLGKVDQKPSWLQKKVEETAQQVIAMKMPLGETIDMIFALEHVPIALREQMVRHRIGHKFGDKIGADIIPDLAGNSTFWSQTTRIIDMGDFFDKGEFYEPPWFEENRTTMMSGYFQDDIADGRIKGTVQDYYYNCMFRIQEMYKNLVSAGVPLEDARGVLPVYLQHRYIWKCNLSSIMHVLSRRGCWLAQLGMWEPVIHGIVEEMATKMHPMFRRLIDPPCFDSWGNYTTCAFKQENEEIVKGKGEYPPCSLWLWKDKFPKDHPDGIPLDGTINDTIGRDRKPRYNKMMEKYTRLWRRDPRSGERIEVG